MKIEVSASIMPDEKVKNEIWNLMKRISKRYNTYHDVRKRFGPHVTVIGFENVDYKNLKNVVSEIKLVCEQTRPFIVKASNIDFFANEKQKLRTPYTIFLKVAKNASLAKLNRILEKKIRKYGKSKSKHFTPHVTLAHGDLTKENFLKAKKDLRNLQYSKNFVTRYLKIMIFREGNRKWEHVRTINFLSDKKV